MSCTSTLNANDIFAVSLKALNKCGRSLLNKLIRFCADLSTYRVVPVYTFSNFVWGCIKKILIQQSISATTCLQRFLFLFLHILQHADNGHSLDHLPIHNMLAIQVRCVHCRDEKLGTICVGSGIRHTQQPRLVMLASTTKQRAYTVNLSRYQQCFFCLNYAWIHINFSAAKMPIFSWNHHFLSVNAVLLFFVLFCF